MANNPPKHLSKEAKTIWRTILKDNDLEKGRLVVLKTALEAYDRLSEARKVIDETGLTYKTESGYMRPNPALQIEKEACSRFLQAWRMLELGMEMPLGRPINKKETEWNEVLKAVK